MARKYTASESASGWTKLGKARRKITKIKRKTAIGQGALSMAGSVATFGMGQAKKAKTAWGEYEAGYEALGGEGFERPKFGQKGYFKGPEGDVRIGDTMYDRSKIQKAGSFLGSDVSAILSDEQRSQYLGRTAPGTAVSTEQLTSELRGRQEQSYKTFLSDPENVQKYGKDIYAEGAGIGDLDKSRQMLTDAGWTGGKTFTSGLKFGQTGGVGASKDLYGFGRKGTAGVQRELTGGDFQPFVAGGERGRDAAGTVAIQESQIEGAYSATGGTDYDMQDVDERSFGQKMKSKLFPDKPFDREGQRKQQAWGRRMGAQRAEDVRMAPILERQRADQAAIGTTVPLPQDTSGINIASRHQQYLQRLGAGDKRMKETGTYSFARGGDFITNGPQKILVGDNPGGRERVTIEPLDSEDIKGYYGKAHNWLEALYANNERRKKY